MKDLMTTLLLLAALLVGALPIHAATDEPQEIVNRVLLRKLVHGHAVVSSRLAPWQRLLDRQYQAMLRDGLAGDLQADSVYLEPLTEPAQRLLRDAELYLGAAHLQALEAAMQSAPAAFKREAAAAIEARQALWSASILPVRQAMADRQLSREIFAPAAERLVQHLLEDADLLAAVGLQKDRLEDFLTDDSRRIWAKVREGDNATHLFSPSYKKAINDIMMDYFRTGRTFGAERPLERAALRYANDDRQSSLTLLLAFVKLINESNPYAQEQGYALLSQAFEKQHSARIAYNLVRVGTRLGTVDDAMLWKLIDHQQYAGDTEGLDELYQLAMVRFLRAGEMAEATRLYEQARRHGLDGGFPPLFRFVLLVQSGQYERLREAAGVDLDRLLATGDPVAAQR